MVDLLRRDGLHDLNHACPTSITPSLTSTLDPPIHAPTTTPSRFSARASSTLGRPISTPWAIRQREGPVLRGGVVTEQRGQRAVGAAGRGVLRHPAVRREHPGPDVELVAALHVQVDVGRHDPVRGDGIEPRSVDPRPAQRGAVLQLRQYERKADRRHLGLVGRGDHVARRERHRRGDRLGRQRLAEGELLGRAELAPVPAVPPADIHRHQAGLLLERHRDAAIDRAQSARRGQGERGADVRVSGERNLRGRREDPDPAGVTPLGRQHERALREVELARDLLHLPVGQALRLRQHRELVAAETRAGEHVADIVSIAHPPPPASEDTA